MKQPLFLFRKVCEMQPKNKVSSKILKNTPKTLALHIFNEYKFFSPCKMRCLD